MHQVFISHSSKDKPIADAVCAALESNNIRCWIAPRDILPGVDWSEAIMNGITTCGVMVLVFTRNSNESVSVKKEVDRAMDKGVVVIPLRIEDVPMNKTLEFHLGKSHCMDAWTLPVESHLQVLVSRVKMLLNPADTSLQPAPPMLPGTHPQWTPPRIPSAPLVPPTRPKSQRATPWIFAVVALLVVALAVGAIEREKLRRFFSQSAEKTAHSNAEPAIQSILVTTPQQLVDAIGPKRVIHLAPGEYVLTGVKEQHMQFVRWDHSYDGNTLTLRDLDNFTLVGDGDKPVRLIVHPRYIYVLNFANCHGIRLANLTFGHTPEGYCLCGVVGATACSDMTFQHCDLFGCGVEGLTLKDVKKLYFEDSTIRDCSYGIMTLTGCTDVDFTRARLAGNKEFWGVQMTDCENVNFYDCTVENNTVAEPLFHATSSSNFAFHRGVIRNNQAKGLSEGIEDESIEGAKLEGNKFKN